MSVELERKPAPEDKRRRWRWIAVAILILLLLLLLLRCPGPTRTSSTGEPTTGPIKAADVRPLFNPWKPTTVPHQDICAGQDCKPVGGLPSTTTDGVGSHRHGSALPFAVDPRVDDPVAQWGDCIASVLACIDAGSDAAACVVAGKCPTPCQQRVAAALDNASSEQEALAAFEKVYMDSGADCRPGQR